MAGHSKWANIKHKKAKEDAARGKAFTKISKEITICAKESGGDPAGNPRLRTLLEKARGINMPNDNIKRAIQKGTGELPGTSYEHYMYEGYAPHGVAILVEVLTDNKNKAIAEMRHAFSKNGGTISAGGSVSWMFEQKGIIKATNCTLSEDELLEALLEYPVEDIAIEDGMAIITCDMKALQEITDAIKKLGVTVEHAEIEWVAKDPIEKSDTEMEDIITFLDALESLDDVQNIYSTLK